MVDFHSTDCAIIYQPLKEVELQRIGSFLDKWRTLDIFFLEKQN